MPTGIDASGTRIQCLIYISISVTEKGDMIFHFYKNWVMIRNVYKLMNTPVH